MKIRLLILCLLPAWLVAQVPAGNSIDLFPDSTLTLRIDPQAQPQASAISGEKSRSKAFFLSLLLPGLGERYVGYRLKSELFLAAEAALWLGYAGFSKSYDWQRSDYVAFAAAHAGADVREKDNAYFLDMENYATIHDYNAAKLRQRNLQAYYRDVETFYWEWDTEENRRRFGDLRVNADRTHNRATLTLGLIVANHLISAIDAMWSVYRYNQGQTAATDWSLQVGDGMTQPSVRLSFSRHF
ncbi:hypothetical protein JW992_10310 [candidate division KSB1 bacterium]|nr:hypothetical protein [candidate division KSB1 bacterium]